MYPHPHDDDVSILYTNYTMLTDDFPTCRRSDSSDTNYRNKSK